MAKRSIDVLVSPDGTVKIETSGYTGKACLEATREFEAWLGGKVAREMKPEGRMVYLPEVAQKIGGA